MIYKKIFKWGVIVIMSAVFFILSSGVHASTIVTDNIIVDTTWTMANSPYVVQTDISVDPGATLTIEPGVIVKLSASRILWIKGRLLAEGTPDNRIIFTSINDDTHGGDTGDGILYNFGTWQTLVFAQATVPSSLKYISIYYARELNFTTVPVLLLRILI